jgi:hypothetical protein
VYDAVAARYGVRINGLDALALTKLDVLDALDEVGIARPTPEYGRSPSFVRRLSLSACQPVRNDAWLVGATRSVRRLRISGERARLSRASKRSPASDGHRSTVGARRHHHPRRCEIPDG